MVRGKSAFIQARHFLISPSSTRDSRSKLSKAGADAVASLDDACIDHIAEGLELFGVKLRATQVMRFFSGNLGFGDVPLPGFVQLLCMEIGLFLKALVALLGLAINLLFLL